MRSNSVPPRFADRTLDGFDAVTPSATKALVAARLLVAGEIGGLVLVGPPGVGKTHLAAGVVSAIQTAELDRYSTAQAAMSPGDPWPTVPVGSLWANVADAVASLRFEIDAPADDRPMSALLRRARSHRGLVVLDDLGREKQSDWTGEAMYALVNARYEAMLPTLVTSNLSAAELRASPYWPALSRLAEDGRLVQIQAPDRRLRGQGAA